MVGEHQTGDNLYDRRTPETRRERHLVVKYLRLKCVYQNLCLSPQNETGKRIIHTLSTAKAFF